MKVAFHNSAKKNRVETTIVICKILIDIREKKMCDIHFNILSNNVAETVF